jgi:hypothetical protein
LSHLKHAHAMLVLAVKVSIEWGALPHKRLQ